MVTITVRPIALMTGDGFVEEGTYPCLLVEGGYHFRDADGRQLTVPPVPAGLESLWSYSIQEDAGD